jgi:xanthine dehydrogenase YagR molybdenum-binding subunit
MTVESRSMRANDPQDWANAVTARTANPRVEGVTKVTGAALYVDDVGEDRFGSPLDTAVVVTSTIAVGRIRSFDLTAAHAVPGVRLVMTHENAPKLRKLTAVAMSEIGELLPLQSDQVVYYGQAVAVVVADTLEAAIEAAWLVRVDYEAAPRPLAFTLADGADRLAPVKRAGMAAGETKKGDAFADYEAAPVKVDARYHCAPHHHNAMETSAVIARWDDDGGVTIRAAVQWHHLETLAVGQAFGLDLADRLPGYVARAALGREFEGKVRLVNTMAGGAFGRNLNPQHLLLACMAAKLNDKGVKLNLTREQTFTLLSYRGEVEQRLRLGADASGRLLTMIQEPDVAVGFAGKYVEPVGHSPCQVYAHGSHYLRHRVARLDLNAPGWMRAPGGSAALFALESGMDELAVKVGLDPLDLRLLNYAETDPESGKPWTQKSLRACYAAGAAAIGWHDRPKGGTPRPDGRIIGYGMATSYESSLRFPASASVTLRQDGTALVRVTAAEIGQGIWTALVTITAEALGLPRSHIELLTDQTMLPAGAGSIASTGTFSNGSAIFEAAQTIKAKLFRHVARDRASPLYGAEPTALSIIDGYIRGHGNAAESVASAMARHSKGPLVVRATTGRDFGRDTKRKKASFGAVFTEISIDPLTMDLAVERMVGAFACGRIIEPAIARNQLLGGMIWGIGQALFEQSHVDRRTGRWVNANLAEALVPTNADIRSIEAIMVDDDETRTHPLGMKGVSEIGVIGPAPAIANAIFDATAKRLRSLPLTVEQRLGA